MAKSNAANLSGDARALVVAMEMLRRSLDDSPLGKAGFALDALQVGSPAAAAGAAADKAISAMSGLMNGFVGKFASVLGPMALLGQVVTSNTSGFQVLGSAVKLLAATLGPVLFPVIAVLAAGLIELSDAIWQDIEPALASFYTLVIGTLLPAVRALIDAFMEAVDFIGKTIFGDGDAKRRAFVEEAREEGMTDEQIRQQAAANNWSPKEIAKALKDADSAKWSEGSGAGNYDGGSSFGAGGDYGGGGGKKTNGLQIVLQEMRRSMGPQAQFSGLAAASRNAQLAAINGSPIERMMLDRLDKMLQTSERIAANTGAIAKKPGTVDF